MVNLTEVTELLNSLCKDRSVSKNVRETLEDIKEMLRDEDKENIGVKIDAALQKIEDISLDPNLSPYVRTQIWNLTSMLESVANGD